MAMPGLSCSTWDLQSSLLHAGSLFAACGIYFFHQGSNPGPLHWEHRVSHWTTIPAVIFWVQLGTRGSPIFTHSASTESVWDEHCKVKVKSLSPFQLFATLRTVALHSPLSMGFSRQEYWSGLPYLPAGDLPDPGIKPRSPALQADSLPSESLCEMSIISPS